MTADIKPVAWHTEDHLTDKSATTYDPVMAERWRSKPWPVSPLYNQSAIDSLRAEVERLQAEIDNRWAQGVHTCHDKCQRIACVLRRERDAAVKRADAMEAERDRMALKGGKLAAALDKKVERAERLAEALRDARDYVKEALQDEREKFAGHEHCSDIDSIMADISAIDFALECAALRDHDQEGDQ